MTQTNESRSTSDTFAHSFKAVVLFVVIGLIAAMTEQLSLAPADSASYVPSATSPVSAAQPVAASASEYFPAHFKAPEGEPAAQIATF
jgi:hypothetical protein